MKKFCSITILLLIILAGSTVCAQQKNTTRRHKQKTDINNNPQRESIQRNKLDNVEENKETSGVPHDNRSNKNGNAHNNVYVPDETEVYQRPFSIVPNTENEEEDELPPFLFQPLEEDFGAESEDEILVAGDSALLHSPKTDISSLTSPIDLLLTNPENGEFFVFPTPEKARATSHFGPRRRRFHYGLDLAMPTGEPVYAAFDGVVRFSKYNRSYGNLIVIRHTNGLETYYAHLSKRHVTPGTNVRAGDIIGLCGNTGRSYGSHLHFEIRYQGNAMNPENVIDCDTRNLISPNLSITPNLFRKVAKKGYENSKKGSRNSSSNYSSDGKYYKVRSGDTLSRIASRNGTSVKKLCKLNGLKETSVLQIGQKIRLR